jgi:urea carboxylase
MEISVCAPYAGTVSEIYVAPGSPVRAGQRVAVIERL